MIPVQCEIQIKETLFSWSSVSALMQQTCMAAPKIHLLKISKFARGEGHHPQVLIIQTTLS